MKLIKQEYVDKGLPRGWQPYYIYQIVVNNEVVGKVVLREGKLEERYYDGHVGYSVDKQYAAFKVIKENFELLKLDNAKVFKLDYQKALHKFADEKIKFDLVILDPPYGKNMVNGILEFLIDKKMLQDNCIVVVEELKEVVFPAFDNLQLVKKYQYGITALNIFKYGVR